MTTPTSPPPAKYYISLANQLYADVAIFDSWLSLNYHKEVNAVDTVSLSIDLRDPRCDLFELDGMITLYRSIPGANLDWYEELTCLFRTSEEDTSESGVQTFKASGLGLADLIARTIINYKEGTIKAEKSMPAERAIKEYVIENCGIEALVAPPYERQSHGVLPDFIVEPSYDRGIAWDGSRPFENLLDVIKDIADFSDLYFSVKFERGINKFVFRVYENLLGVDRSTVGLSPVTGLNAAGNSPVVFSLESGTLSSVNYTHDRSSESNVVSVLGDGDGATREIQVVERLTKNDSPWNRREISRAQGGYISEMQTAGEELLNELESKKVISFSPLQQMSCLYGLHYNVGDIVTISSRGREFHRAITAADINVGKPDSITFTFSEP